MVSLDEYLLRVSEGTAEGCRPVPRFGMGCNYSGINTQTGELRLELNGEVERVLRYTNRSKKLSIMTAWNKETVNINKQRFIINIPDEAKYLEKKQPRYGITTKPTRRRAKQTNG
jgi:hypothetical protein